MPKEAIARIHETELYLETVGTHARIVVKGADHEEGLLGSGVDEMILDEAQNLKKHVWTQILRPMLIGRKGRATIIGTKRPKNWFKTLWLDAHYNKMPAGYIAAHFPSTENPLVSVAEWARTRIEVGEHIWSQEFMSNPLDDTDTNSEIKYSEFNRKDHVCEYFNIPDTWKRYLFMDWGMHHPAVCLWAAVDPTGTIYIYDEYSCTNKSADVFAQAVMEKNGRKPFEFAVLDPQCWRRESDLSCVANRIRNGGIRALRPGTKEDHAESGASRVKGYLRPVYGPPRLKIFPHCLKLIDEFESLEWDNENGDDFTDSLRYGVVAISAISGLASEFLPPDQYDRTTYEDGLRLTYKGESIVKAVPLKKRGGNNVHEPNDFGEFA